jgi:hypothetical protein
VQPSVASLVRPALYGQHLTGEPSTHGYPLSAVKLLVCDSLEHKLGDSKVWWCDMGHTNPHSYYYPNAGAQTASMETLWQMVARTQGANKVR